ncbi:ArsA family ATPase [bacterium]|nr:ArsA family ATPase [bacterium]
MRIIFFAGKGGVGKTSIAAATGIKSSLMGYKTIIISLDAAHSLSDIFDLGEGLFDYHKGKAFQVLDNLFIQELDIQEELEKNWGEIYKYFSSLLNTTGIDEILAEELSIIPGMEEVSLLFYINRYVKENTYDVIILDCAPTGEALRFISIPTALEWYMKKLFRMEKTLAKYVGPLAERIYNIPVPGERYFDAVADLFGKLKGVDEVLVNPRITTVRLVTNPEKIVLKETQRAFMYFCLNRISIDAIIMNRILPEDIKDPYFLNWRKDQLSRMKEAENLFSPVPVFRVKLFDGEIFGTDRLRQLSDEIYKGIDPLDRLYKDEPYKIIKENGAYQMIIKLPFITRENVDLKRISDELIIRIGGMKRNILLPRHLADAKTIEAKYKGQDLFISFKGEQNG